MGTTPGAAARTCAACGAAGGGRFCPECGQPYGPLEDSPRRMLRADAADAVGFDTRLWATLKDLLIHPVRVVAAAVAGDRRRYLPPVRVLLTLSGVYVFVLLMVQPAHFDLRPIVTGPRSATLSERLQQRGLSADLANERFQSRMNTAFPLGIAAAIVPLAGVLELFDRRRRWHEHLLYMVGASNAGTLASLALVPLALVGTLAYWVPSILAFYAYLGVTFAAFYPGRTRARTGLRFALFAAANLAVSAVFGILFPAAVLVSLFLF